MRKSTFKDAKTVLVFNGQRTLIAVAYSVRSAADFSKNNPMQISFACSGESISYAGFYFRHLDPRVELEMSDIGHLKLEEYDKMCEIKRPYHTVHEMAKKKRRTEAKFKKKLDSHEEE